VVNRKDKNLVRCYLIKDCKGELAKDSPSELSINQGIGTRRFKYALQGFIDAKHEGRIQSLALNPYHVRASASSASASG